MFNMLKKKNYILLVFHNITQIVKSKLFFSWSQTEKRHYLAVKKLSSLLRGITSNINGDFYYSNCLHSFRTKTKLGSHKKVCEKKDFCNVIMPFEDTKILEFSHCLCRSYIIIEKIDGCKNNPKSSSTTKVSEHIPSGFSMSTISPLKSIENKCDVYRGKDCMKKFCESLIEHAIKIINFKKKKNGVINKRAGGIIRKCKNVIFVKKNLELNIWKIKNIVKLHNHCHHIGKYRGAVHGICNFKYRVPKKIPIVFHNGSNFDYHFIIKVLAKEF